MARCGISRQVAGRELAGLVRAGLLRPAGAGVGRGMLQVESGYSLTQWAPGHVRKTDEG